MKFVKVIFILVIAAVLVLAGGSYWVYRSLNSPHTHDKASEYIVIPKGSTPDEILNKLTTEGIITNSWPLKLYLRFSGTKASALQAGEYQFESPITQLGVLEELQKGEERTVKLTIPEGFSRFDIAKRIAEKFPQNPTIDEKQILALMDDTSDIRDLAPEATNLEGYMYPSTYSVPRDAKPKDIIKMMVTQFKKIWKPEWNDQAKQLGRTPHEIVTLASLIETESGITSERPIVASVIYNRINKNIPLGIDMTSIYVAKMQNRWDGEINKSDLEADSPYNTRKYGGIPPGPISSVSETAISAALNPAQTDYIYYVET